MELLQPGREFIREGHLEEYPSIPSRDSSREIDTQFVYYALFNDTLLRAEKKKNKFGTLSTLRPLHREKYQLSDQIPIYNIAVTLIDDSRLFFYHFFKLFRKFYFEFN